MGQLLKTILVLCSLVYSSTASPSVIKSDPYIDLQGLEWLSFDATYNVNYDEIDDALANSQFGPRWRFALSSEVALLMDSWNRYRGMTDNWPFSNVGTKEHDTYAYFYQLFGFDPFANNLVDEFVHNGDQYKFTKSYNHLIYSGPRIDTSECSDAAGFSGGWYWVCAIYAFAETNQFNDAPENIWSSTPVFNNTGNSYTAFTVEEFVRLDTTDNIVGDTYNKLYANGLPAYHYLIVRENSISVSEPSSLSLFGLIFVLLSLCSRKTTRASETKY